jgi:hypothetical protein
VVEEIGKFNQVRFPNNGYFRELKQVKIDSLNINQIVTAARTVDLDGKDGVDWKDPMQLFVLSTSGDKLTQLTADDFFARTWIVNKQTGTLIVTGHYDTNKNGKYDKTDKSEMVIYSLSTLKLVATI